MGKTTGDVVKLFLCRSCKGLFVLDSQVEKHVTTCNGDAYKSPANLFACERDYFLELVAPTFVTAADDNTAVSKRKTKRRKTTPRSHSAPRSRCKRRSLSESHSVDTLSQRSDSDMEIDTRRSLTPCSQSDSQTGSFGLINFRPKTCDSLAQSASDIIFDSADNESLTTTQTIIVSLPLQISGNSQSKLYSQNLLCDAEVVLNKTNENKISYTSYDSTKPRSEITRTNSTPAINFLTYLNALQQQNRSVSTSDLSEMEQQRQAVSFSTDQSTPSRDENRSIYSRQNSASPVSHVVLSDGSENCMAPGTNILVELPENSVGPAIREEATHSEDYHFRLANISGDHADRAFSVSQGLQVQCKENFTSTEDNFQHVFIQETFADVHDKTIVCMTDESCDGDVASISPSRPIVNGNKSLDSVTSKSSSVLEVEQTVYKNESVPSITETGSEHNTETLFVNSERFQGQILYIIEPDTNKLLQTVVADDLISEISQSNSSNTFVLSSDATLKDFIGESNITANSPLETTISTSSVNGYADFSEEHLQPDSTGTIIIETENTPCTDNFQTTDDVSNPWQGKSHSQALVRHLEQTALREVVLQQATEIAPDSDYKKVRYSCNLCGHVAKSVKFMQNHLQVHSDGKVFFECDQCDFKSRRRCKLTEHQQRHSRSRLLCHSCPATFLDLSSLNRHITAKHMESPKLKCDLCDYSAYGMDDLREHKLKHTGETLSCEVEGCGYKTPYLRLLRSHQKRHTGVKNHKCSWCDFQAVDKTTVARHMRTHSLHRPFQCNSCAFRANTKYDLTLHQQRLHPQPNQVPTSYTCNKCSFSTLYPSSLTKHLKTHPASFPCPLCEHSTSSLELVKNHIREVHQLEDASVEPMKNKASIKEDTFQAAEEMADKPLMESLMTEAMAVVDSQDLASMGITELDRCTSRIDPMKLSFHFQDQTPGNPFMSSGSGTSLTRSSSIPDLFTFSGINRSTSQSDLFLFPGINTMTRANSMSDLVSFASSMCADGAETVNMDLGLSDAAAPVVDVGVSGLTLGEGPEVALTVGGRPGSPGGFVLGLQCCKCLDFLVNEEQVDAHKKICNGTVIVV